MSQVQSKMSQTNDSWFQHRGFAVPPSSRTPEAVWRMAERFKIKAERLRLLRIGAIIAPDYCQPQMLVKDENGRWCPELRIN
jgi:hypothetical protein